jgi:hypothetical protein
LLVTLFKQQKFTYRPTERRENNLGTKWRHKEVSSVGAISNRGQLKDVNLRVIAACCEIVDVRDFSLL